VVEGKGEEEGGEEEGKERQEESRSNLIVERHMQTARHCTACMRFS
jgi:hypothetical protein